MTLIIGSKFGYVGPFVVNDAALAYAKNSNLDTWLKLAEVSKLRAEDPMRCFQWAVDTSSEVYMLDYYLNEAAISYAKSPLEEQKKALISKAIEWGKYF